ncbi:MAG: hypothetical protein E6K43_05285 [Gammaproteobacteria bacterium]|nr:MAG: hypothetical protein E6K43_05285 [Gammaproteobacteria bacterium]
MKTIASMAILLGFAGTAVAQESVSPYRLGSWVPRDTNSCDTIYGDGRQLCLADRYHIQQEDKAREQQGSLQRAQEENQRLRNELLRRELAQPGSPSTASPTSTVDFASIPGFASWRAENRWFGADRARTEYALLYAKDLRLEQPDLTGRPFLNALSARVREIFASGKH